MPLDPEAQAYNDLILSFNIDWETLDPVQAREMSKGMLAQRPPGEPVARVEDRLIPGPALQIPIRIYTPGGKGPFPVLVFLHTGGYSVGDLDTQDPLCRRIANKAGSIVVAVAYRLAPEYPFPAALEDSFAATQWAVSPCRRVWGRSSTRRHRGR